MKNNLFNRQPWNRTIGAIRKLRGKTYTFDEIRKAIRGARVELFGVLPADMDARDLFEMSLKEGWIKERSNNCFVVTVL